jgi:hypothetical protein
MKHMKKFNCQVSDDFMIKSVKMCMQEPKWNYVNNWGTDNNYPIKATSFRYISEADTTPWVPPSQDFYCSEGALDPSKPRALVFLSKTRAGARN